MTEIARCLNANKNLLKANPPLAPIIFSSSQSLLVKQRLRCRNAHITSEILEKRALSSEFARLRANNAYAALV
ncbi:hypothetical protein SFRURICE_003309 [Spodoptera frugiperda]|uniref:SFRICE_023177 n=1 Tax=Spodoptera frugiperda TaxID=7108 RepID=A0A2H1W1Q2_SPOFR|nr:hypothetical protein SFRURICE_003309 [Spodoptera frugiperda]